MDRLKLLSKGTLLRDGEKTKGLQNDGTSTRIARPPHRMFARCISNRRVN